MEIKNLIDQIQETRKLADRDPDTLTGSTRVGMLTAINQAKHELTSLTNRYGTELFKNVRGVFVTGDSIKAAQFASLPQKEGESLTVDVDAMYRRIADPVEPSIANSTHRELKPEHVNIMISVLRDIGQELDLIDLPMLNIKEYPILANSTQVFDFVKNVVRESIGDTLNRDYFVKETVAQAIKTLYSKPVTNIVLLNASPEEIEAFKSIFTSGHQVVAVTETDDVDAVFVAKSLGTSVSEPTAHKTNKKHKN